MTYIPTKLKSLFSITHLIMIHYFEYNPDFIFRGETHDFWEAVYVDKGKIEAGADEKKYVLSAGQMIFHQPMEFHTLRALSGTAPNLFIISFKASGKGMDFFRGLVCEPDERDKHFISSIILESRRAFSTPLNVPAAEHLRRLAGDTAEAEQLIRIYLENLLIHIKRHSEKAGPADLYGRLPEKAYLSLPDPENMDPRFIRIRSYLLNHLEQHLTVEEIAREHMISRSHLQAIFRKQINTGVMDFFRRLKIDKAKELIREKELDFSEIAFSLGYSSLSAFSKQFKQVTTMSPKTYKESVKPEFTRGKTAEITPKEDAAAEAAAQEHQTSG